MSRTLAAVGSSPGQAPKFSRLCFSDCCIRMRGFAHGFEGSLGGSRGQMGFCRIPRANRNAEYNHFPACFGGGHDSLLNREVKLCLRPLTSEMGMMQKVPTSKAAVRVMSQPCEGSRRVLSTADWDSALSLCEDPGTR